VTREGGGGGSPAALASTSEGPKHSSAAFSSCRYSPPPLSPPEATLLRPKLSVRLALGMPGASLDSTSPQVLGPSSPALPRPSFRVFHSPARTLDPLAPPGPRFSTPRPGDMSVSDGS